MPRTASEKLHKLAERLKKRRQRQVERARVTAEAKREWERTGEVGRHGAHEGYSSSGF